MLVLGIETSCDETGLAVYDTARGLLAHALHSQVAMHSVYGGVVPELASRDHVRRVVPLAQRVLAEAGARSPTSTASPTRRGPAWPARCWSARASPARSPTRWASPRSASTTWKATCSRRCWPIRSRRSRSSRCWCPAATASCSRSRASGRYRLLGDTKDDAAGEAFDKTAKLLGLPYPGGPALARPRGDRDATAPCRCRGRCSRAATST